MAGKTVSRTTIQPGAAHGDVAAMGLRERHKIDKQNRISEAAIALFGREGFDGTTLRDIAREADVALGTLSLYARDKRDLVMMIFNKVVPPLMERGRRNTDARGRIVDNMIAFFEPFYNAYNDEIMLYRIVLGQIYNGPDSAHADANDRTRLELLDMIGDIILRAMAAGECRADVDVGTQARSFFYLYFAAVRVWLFQDKPDVGQGLAELRTLYDQHMVGLLPHPR